jgi:5-hydroxyisourate hydrolase-like protein (transthyretin family)
VVVDLQGADSGAGTLADPFLGLFDSACNLLELNDDAVGFDSRLVFVVPANGVFVLAATSCCDGDFTGDGGSDGTYALTTSPAPPAIGSIAGRVVDAVSGEPLPGDSPPFAFVELFRCDGDECFEFVNNQSTDSDGRFRFEQDFLGDPIPVGTYEVNAFAEDFQQGSTGPFDVGEGEDFDVGDIPLAPPPFFISDIQPCAELLPQGGTCNYSATLNNNTSAQLTGLVWSPVDSFSLGSSLDFTLFEASTRPGIQIAVRERVSVAAFGAQTVQFQFEVPSFVQQGATFCTRVFLGLDPDPLVNTFLERFLFCISKGDSAFEVMAEAQSRKMFRALSGRSQMHAAPAPKAQ